MFCLQLPITTCSRRETLTSRLLTLKDEVHGESTVLLARAEKAHQEHVIGHDVEKPRL
jgi:hypothetical protein